MQFFFRLIVLSTLLLFLVACPETEPPSDCKIDDDCLSGQVCCKAKKDEKTGSCKKKDECKSAVVCDGTACKTQSDCSAKETCTEGCCKNSGGGQDCKKHLDCPKNNDCVPSGSGKKCLACAEICTSTLDCSGGGKTCENGCCRLPSCKTDGDCKDRTDKNFCKLTTGECVACLESKNCQKTNEQSVCRNDRCAKVECTADRHCVNPKKPTCNQESFKCIESPVCRSDNDCTDPQLSRCDPNADGGKGACKKGSCVQCDTDDDCGPSGDFCVGKTKGLKDGKRCLKGCKEDKDCPSGFKCLGTIVNGFKVCFPRIEYCVDPCSKITCSNDEVCVEGICKPKPKPCNVCTTQDKSTCEPGADCLNLGGKFFCGRACKSSSDCPTDRKYDCLNSQCLALDGCK